MDFANGSSFDNDTGLIDDALFDNVTGLVDDASFTEYSSFANTSSFYAVIPAGGRSSRMGQGVDKQFLDLAGIPVLARSLIAFENCDKIKGIVLASPEESHGQILGLCEKYKISKLMGLALAGESRQASVLNALIYLDSRLENYDRAKTFVLIHDGARPFIKAANLESCMEACQTHQAALLAVPVKDTIKIADKDKMVVSTPDRDSLWSVQTPQAFLLDEILKMHIRAKDLDINFTDDASLTEYYGQPVKIVEGSYTNIKITTAEDILIGESILKAERTEGEKEAEKTEESV